MIFATACLLGFIGRPWPVEAVDARCPVFDHQHGAWTRVLRENVKDGVVDYAALHANNTGLRGYLAALETVCADDYATWSRNQKLAFWINAYNAYTIRLILDNYPISSIRSIGFLPGAAFRQEFIPMQELRGGVISLQAVENDILRGELAEPRIHFAIVCASRSCPVLASVAYTGAELDRQLEASAKGFLADPFRNRWDPEANTLHLSSIFHWFRGDFEQSAGSLLDFVSRYLPGQIASEIRKPGLAVEFLPYDWSLNGK